MEDKPGRCQTSVQVVCQGGKHRHISSVVLDAPTFRVRLKEKTETETTLNGSRVPKGCQMKKEPRFVVDPGRY